MLKQSVMLALAILAFGLPAQAEVACNRPAKLKIPDPAKADAKDFERAYGELKTYHGAVTAFTQCLDREAKDVSAEYVAVSQEYERGVKAYNAAAEKANKGQ